MVVVVPFHPVKVCVSVLTLVMVRGPVCVEFEQVVVVTLPMVTV